MLVSRNAPFRDNSVRCASEPNLYPCDMSDVYLTSTAHVPLSSLGRMSYCSAAPCRLGACHSLGVAPLHQKQSAPTTTTYCTVGATSLNQSRTATYPEIAPSGRRRRRGWYCDQSARAAAHRHGHAWPCCCDRRHTCGPSRAVVVVLRSDVLAHGLELMLAVAPFLVRDQARKLTSSGVPKRHDSPSSRVLTRAVGQPKSLSRARARPHVRSHNHLHSPSCSCLATRSC